MVKQRVDYRHYHYNGNEKTDGKPQSLPAIEQQGIGKGGGESKCQEKRIHGKHPDTDHGNEVEKIH